MSDLIKRIDAYNRAVLNGLEHESSVFLLTDCLAEIQRLIQVNDSLHGLCDEFELRIKTKGEYVPMTRKQFADVFRYLGLNEFEYKLFIKLEAEVIKRAGLRVKGRE